MYSGPLEVLRLFLTAIYTLFMGIMLMRYLVSEHISSIQELFNGNIKSHSFAGPILLNVLKAKRQCQNITTNQFPCFKHLNLQFSINFTAQMTNW
jgi:DNA-binding MltR family transcriptional regulator